MTQRMNPEKRKAQLLEHARTLFHNHGYEQVRVDDILNASSISKGGFYHHFDSKDDVLRLLIAQEVADVTSHITATQKASVTDRLTALLAAGSVYLEGTPGIIETLGSFTSKSLYLDAIEDGFEQHLKPELIQLIARGVADGTFTQVDPHTTAEMFMAINNHANRKSVFGQWPDAQSRAFGAAGIALLGSHLGIADKLTNINEQLKAQNKGMKK